MKSTESLMLSIGVAIACLFPVAAPAQSVSLDNTFSENFRCEVKTIGEFIERFNGAESHPDVAADSNMRKANICALFDVNEMLREKGKDARIKQVYAFCDSVADRNVRISLNDGSMYAVADCKISYEGKKHLIKLGLLQETLSDGYTRWGLYAVAGLDRIGAVKARQLYNFSPVEHEIHFMGLSDVLNENPENAFGYRLSTNEIDQLSVFLALVQAGKIRIEMVESMNIVCIAVPGFIFEITERVRDSHNSGWLISKLIPATTEEKIKFINNMFAE